MSIFARIITARAITAQPITASVIKAAGTGVYCPLTFENGILNANRVLCSGQLLIGVNNLWVDGQLWIDGEPWYD